jgi:NAD(P)-dependent dehydrogenase (short-subunit alcohol dehydrogenase family)
MQTPNPTPVPVALVTGASRGLGRALAARLVASGWHVVVDARDAAGLARSMESLPASRVTAIAGDVSDDWHRAALADAVEALGRLDLLVNNASTLGPSPQPDLADYPLKELERVYAVNTFAPLALAQLVLGVIERSGGSIITISSDAAVEAYAGWGGYGSSKAALDQLTAVLAAEHPGVRVYSVDPGDMATDLHQQAFPGEDISDRPAPGSVVPALMRLVEGDLPSGRYRADELRAGATA